MSYLDNHYYKNLQTNIHKAMYLCILHNVNSPSFPQEGYLYGGH